MTHERVLELVKQVNGALALVSWPFIIYEALGKSASLPDLKTKLDLRRDEIFSAIILDIEDAMRPFWPVPRSRRLVSEDGKEDIVWDWPTVLSDDARDAVRNCMAKNEGLSVQAAKIRRLAGRVLAWDKLTFRCILCAAVLALFGLATWFFDEGMPERIATAAIIVPLIPAILALAAAATRQTYMQRANDAIIEEENSSKRIAECDLYSPVARFLSREGYTRIFEELQFCERSIDVYGVAPGEEARTVAVELKLRKWQKALQQAALYQLCSDYSYVAMPKHAAEGLEPKAFSAAGIGILAVDTTSKAVEVVLPAMLSTQVRGHYISAYKKKLRR